MGTAMAPLSTRALAATRSRDGASTDGQLIGRRTLLRMSGRLRGATSIGAGLDLVVVSRREPSTVVRCCPVFVGDG